MKKIILILSALILISGAVFAEENDISIQTESSENTEAAGEITAEKEFIPSENYLAVQELIDDSLNDNLSQISLMANTLSDEEKDHLYKENEVAYWPIALNALGFGIGSYVQGNTKEAVRATICDAIGTTGLVVCGIYFFTFGAGGVIEAFLSALGGSEPQTDLLTRAAVCYGGMIVSASLLTVSGIISIVSSCVYPSMQNKKLTDAIYPNKNNSPEFTLLPTFTPDKNIGIAPGFICSINF